LISKAQAEVVKIIADVGCKVLLVVTCIGVYITAVVSLIRHPNYPVGIFDSVLTIGIGRVILHYFPSKRDGSLGRRRHVPSKADVATDMTE
jgi:hypothetical protein